ncbi:LOW QUALITY PROTEIN: FAD binding domain-containing protein [Colletotrichum tofieldiae]|nr:LOW QUALITY PROTEIN: FAD binding domain-containing protein [Colletotrichum tofieldiae]
MKVLNRAALGNTASRVLFQCTWRKLDGTYISGLKNEIHRDDPDRMVSLPMRDLTRLIYDQSKDLPMIKFLFHHRVTGIGQDDNKAWVGMENGETGEMLQPSADYIYHPTVTVWDFVPRHDMGRVDRGYQRRFCPLSNRYQCLADLSKALQVDFKIRYVAAKATKDGVWRVTYDDTISLTNEEAIGRQPERFKTLRPEHHPKPNEYKLISISPYKVHQRLTESMVAGRILLAAGAAHLCNPLCVPLHDAGDRHDSGGLGHTGGIVDVDGLFECSSGINHGKENEKTLHGVYGKASINFDEVLASDEFLKRYEEAESDQENLKELTKVSLDDRPL